MRNLKAEMARKNVTKDELAKLLNKTPQTIRNRLNEKLPFTQDEMQKIRDTYFKDLSIDYLFFEN